MNEDHGTGALRGRIARARVRQASRRRNLLRGLTGAVLLVAVIGAGVWLALQLGGQSPPGPSLVDSAPAEPQDIESPPARPVSRPAQSVDSAPAEPRDVESPPAGPVSESTQPSDSPDDVAPAQAQVDALLQRLEAALRSIPAGAVPRPELDAAAERIHLARDKALEAHRDGDSDSALRLLAGAVQEAEELVRNEEARFRLTLQAAEDAYAAENAADARMHITEALQHRPDDSEAIAWEARIAQLPELLAERRKAEDARATGRLHEERAALRRIIELDPDDAGERVAAVDRELREQAFARAIAQGRQAVENRVLEQAKQALAEAQRRDPEHADTQQLQTQVAALERALIRDRHLAAAEQAAGRDDWEAALAAFEHARAVEPTHDAAVSGSGLATRIVNAQRAVDEFLSRPGRLGSPRVADAARDALRQAVALTALSARLASSAEGLERAIEAARTPVPVQIVSDEETEIGIRGVGTVGRVRERTIELLPGEYVFEGKRRGYRSKLVDVVVQANLDTPLEVRVVCDERS